MNYGRMRPTYFRILILIILPILCYFHFRGLVFGEEGYLLNSTSKLLNGSIPYRDYYYPHNPLGIFILSFAFLLFGESVFSARILILILNVLSIWIIFNTVKSITKRLIYSLLSVLIFVAWGPAHLNFASPTTMALPIILLVIYLILISESKKNALIHFLIGILSFIAFLMFQNFIIILLPIAIHYLISKSNRSSLVKFIYGFIWGIIIFTIYLLLTNSFASYLNSFIMFYSFMHDLNSLTLSSYEHLNAPTLLILPISSLLTTALLLYRKKYNLIFIPLVILSCFFALARVSSNEELYPILSLAGILIVIFINKLPTFTIKLLSYLIIFISISAGFYTALFKNYYKAAIPLVEQNSYLGGKISLYVDENFKVQHHELEKLIALETKPDDYIFVHSFYPMIYFIYDRKNPVPYDRIESTNSAYYEDLVKYSLVGKSVKLALIDENEQKDGIEKFIIEKYRLKRKIGQYSVYLEP